MKSKPRVEINAWCVVNREIVKVVHKHYVTCMDKLSKGVKERETKGLSLYGRFKRKKKRQREEKSNELN